MYGGGCGGLYWVGGLGGGGWGMATSPRTHTHTTDAQARHNCGSHLVFLHAMPPRVAYLEGARLAVVADEVVLVQRGRRRVQQVRPALLQERVPLLFWT